MKKMMKRVKENKNGITLIALVITIIVLLIISGVTIATLTGENGLLLQANKAKIQTEEGKKHENQLLNTYETAIDETINNAITANTIANAKNKNEYYGQQIVNYSVNPSIQDEDIKWKILYSGPIGNGKENNIYLIASDYVKYTNLPQGRDINGNKTDKKLTPGTTIYKANWNDELLKIYNTGSERITDSNIKRLNNDYFNIKNHSSTTNNMNAVAYMLDTTAWFNYVDKKYADYAIGGPTIELLFKSYNQKFGFTGNNEYKAQANSNIGYEVSYNGGETWENGFSGLINSTDPLYVISSIEKAKAYWIASPSAFNDSYVTRLYYNGYLNNSWSSADNGFRPLVCLDSSVKLRKVENGYEIY